MTGLPWGAGHCPARPFFFATVLRRGALCAAALFLALAAAGQARADFAAGLAAYDGGDYEAAYRAWLPLAEAGNLDARAAIADLYLSELLVEPDGPTERGRVQATGARWYHEAARCGHVIAQLNLGELYSSGTGVARDPVAAYVWLGLAARNGNRWAAARQVRIASNMSAAQRDAAAARLSAWAVDAGCGSLRGAAPR